MAAREQAAGTNGVAEEISELRRELGALRSRLVVMGRSHGEALKAEGREALGQLQEELDGVLQEVGDHGRAIANQAREQVRERPVAAVGLAFLIGMIVSALLARR